MTNKNKKHIVIATAIIILVVALLIYRYYIPDMKPKKQFTPASVEYTYTLQAEMRSRSGIRL